MLTGTWIKLNRNILKWEWYQNGNTMRVFIHLLLRANVNDGKIEGISYSRGQLITSYGNLSRELGMSIQQIRTALGHLVETKEINISTINGRFVIITVNNYNKYQESEEKPETVKKTVKRTARQSKPAETHTEKPKQKPEKYVPIYWEIDIPKQAWGRFTSPEEYQQYVDTHREEALSWVTN